MDFNIPKEVENYLKTNSVKITIPGTLNYDVETENYNIGSVELITDAPVITYIPGLYELQNVSITQQLMNKNANSKLMNYTIKKGSISEFEAEGVPKDINVSSKDKERDFDGLDSTVSSAVKSSWSNLPSVDELLDTKSVTTNVVTLNPIKVDQKLVIKDSKHLIISNHMFDGLGGAILDAMSDALADMAGEVTGALTSLLLPSNPFSSLDSNGTDTEAAKVRWNYISPIDALLMQSPDFMSNMFTGVFCYGGTLVNVFTNYMEGEKKTMGDTFSLSQSTAEIATRLEGIDIPQTKNDTFEMSACGHKIKKIATSSNTPKTVEVKFRLDNPMYMYHFFNQMSGNKTLQSYSVLGDLEKVKAFNSFKKIRVYDNFRWQRPKDDLAGNSLNFIVAYKADTSYGLTKDTKVSVSKRVRPTKMDTFESRYLTASNIKKTDAPFTDYTDSKHRLSMNLPDNFGTIGMQYFLFEDIQFLGQSGDIELKADSANTITVGFKFTYRRLSKVIPGYAKEKAEGTLPSNFLTMQQIENQIRDISTKIKTLY